jgi:hypothetical protein
MRKTESASPGVVVALIGVRGSISVKVRKVDDGDPGGGVSGPPTATPTAQSAQATPALSRWCTTKRMGFASGESPRPIGDRGSALMLPLTGDFTRLIYPLFKAGYAYTVMAWDSMIRT